MKKIFVLLAIFALVALFVLGCTKQSQYPTGNVAYGQQQNPQYQGYVGGGCAVAGTDNSVSLDVSEPSLAA